MMETAEERVARLRLPHGTTRIAFPMSLESVRNDLLRGLPEAVARLKPGDSLTIERCGPEEPYSFYKLRFRSWGNKRASRLKRLRWAIREAWRTP